MNKSDKLIDEGRMLRIKDVLRMWPVSAKWLWEQTFKGEPGNRIPSYKFGGKRLYKYDELQWWGEKHRQFHNVSTKEAESEN